RIDRLEAAREPVRGLGTTAGEAFTRLHGAALVDEVRLFDQLDVVAAFERRDVEQPQFRIVGRRLPVLAAEMRWAQLLTLRLGASAMAVRVVNLHAAGGMVVERPTGFGIEARRPIQLVDILLAGNERAVGAVERIEEAVARRVDNELAILAIDLGVDDRV